LGGLGTLYSNTGRRAEADKAYIEAPTIYRNFVSGNPTKYAGKIASLTKLLAKIQAKSSATTP
jgi:hypothetical protein